MALPFLVFVRNPATREGESFVLAATGVAGI